MPGVCCGVKGVEPIDQRMLADLSGYARDSFAGNFARCARERAGDCRGGREQPLVGPSALREGGAGRLDRARSAPSAVGPTGCGRPGTARCVAWGHGVDGMAAPPRPSRVGRSGPGDAERAWSERCGTVAATDTRPLEQSVCRQLGEKWCHAMYRRVEEINPLRAGESRERPSRPFYDPEPSSSCCAAYERRCETKARLSASGMEVWLSGSARSLYDGNSLRRSAPRSASRMRRQWPRPAGRGH